MEEDIKPFLASRIPNLSFDGFIIDNERFSLEFDTDGGFRIDAKLIPSEPSKELSFTNRGITDQHDFEDVIDLLIVISIQIRHPSFPFIQKKQKSPDHEFENLKQIPRERSLAESTMKRNKNNSDHTRTSDYERWLGIHTQRKGNIEREREMRNGRKRKRED